MTETPLNTSRTYNLHAYETLAPDWLTKHKPRTIERIATDPQDIYTLSLLSEIGDGIFVAWSSCARCSKHYLSCPCKEGPLEPTYITKWRGERFDRSFDGRPSLKRELIPSVVTSLRDRGFIVGEQKKAPKKDLTSVIAAAQAAQDASVGDSNDDEIDRLREALDEALTALDLTLPDPTQWHEDDLDEQEARLDAERTELAEFVNPPIEDAVAGAQVETAIDPESTVQDDPTDSEPRDLTDIQIDF